MPNTHTLEHNDLLEILEMVARADLDVADMLAREHGFNDADREYIRTGRPVSFADFPPDAQAEDKCSKCNGKEI